MADSKWWKPGESKLKNSKWWHYQAGAFLLFVCVSVVAISCRAHPLSLSPKAKRDDIAITSNSHGIQKNGEPGRLKRTPICNAQYGCLIGAQISEPLPQPPATITSTATPSTPSIPQYRKVPAEEIPTSTEGDKTGKKH